MAFVGDAANWVLGGIPGDVHDMFTPDVDPSELMKASMAMTDLADTVASVHLQLNDGIATIQGRWKGDGATAFQTDIWQPLSDGLDVLERESHTASSQLAQLAGQAAEAHVAKIGAIEQEIQTQLNVTAVTWVLTPAAGKAISEVVSAVASRLAGDVVTRLVGAIVDAIEDLLRRVLGAFATLLEWTAESAGRSVIDIGDELGRIVGRKSPVQQAPTVATPVDRADSVNLASPARTDHVLNGDATGGGHLWPGKPGKSPFPPSWSPDRIMAVISDVATDPNSTVITRLGRRTVIAGERDGVRILVVTDGRDIITAYPTNLPRNP